MKPSCIVRYAPGLVLLGILLPFLAGIVLAQSGGGYDLSWNTVDGGGYTWGMGGDYSLSGTAGQPDVGTSEGRQYILSGGFWPSKYRVYLPLVLRNR